MKMKSQIKLLFLLYLAFPFVKMEAFKQNEVIPDVIPAVPKEVCSVKYGNVEVNLGNKLTPTQVKNEPVLTWNGAPNEFYTICMTDPDAPSRQNPKFREWHHWLVGNIPGNDIKKGDVLTGYVGSAPPKDSGFHRYVFLVYKQKGKLKFDEEKIPNTSGKNRPKFSAKKFAEKYDLGDPIASNFFQAQYDDYVPTVYKQLKN